MPGEGLTASLLFGLFQGLVDRSLEVIERSGASNKADPLDFAGIIGIGLGQDEARSSGRPSFLRLGHVLANGRSVFLGAHAQLESGFIEPDRLGVSDPGLELTLVGKQPTVHLPELALVAGAVRSLGRFEGEPVDRLEREVEGRVAELARLYVLLFDLRVRLTDVSGAERSLVVGELDHRQFGRVLPLG